MGIILGGKWKGMREDVGKKWWGLRKVSSLVKLGDVRVSRAFFRELVKKPPVLWGWMHDWRRKPAIWRMVSPGREIWGVVEAEGPEAKSSIVQVPGMQLDCCVSAQTTV